ncbi:MAG: pancreas/duodenum homeobox protein 1 [Desulforhopalus sp.]
MSATTTTNAFEEILSKENLLKIFPEERADEFFEALFGDADEGAYDIELAYREANNNTLVMDLLLKERPNCCLACNLTQGLPQVFSRHPIINVNGIVSDIDALLGDGYSCTGWSLGYTEQYSRSLHAIPIKIDLTRK